MPITAGYFGTAAAFVSLILLIFVSISTPIWNSLSFLTATIYTFQGRGRLTMGVWGACFQNPVRKTCTAQQLGYELQTLFNTSDYSAGGRQVNLGTDALGDQAGITQALVLHVVAGGLAFIGFACSAVVGAVNHTLTLFVLFVGFLTALAALIIDLVIFLQVQKRINAVQPGSAGLDDATWLTAGAAGGLLLATILVNYDRGGHLARTGGVAYAGVPGGGSGFPWKF